MLSIPKTLTRKPCPVFIGPMPKTASITSNVKTLSVKLDAESVRMVKERAKAKGLSVSGIIRKTIHKLLGK